MLGEAVPIKIMAIAAVIRWYGHILQRKENNILIKNYGTIIHNTE